MHEILSRHTVTKYVHEVYSKMIAKVDATATNARQTHATLATECMIRNADKRVSVVALARFRCRFCTKSLLSLLLRRPCERFRDRCISTVLFIRNRYGNHGREMCAEPTAGEPRGRTRPARGVPRRRRGSLTLRATSRQLRGACGSPAVRRECAKTENAAEGVKACVTPKLV